MFTKTCNDAIFPTRGTNGSCGYDFHALNNFCVEAHSQQIVDTGIIVNFKPDTALFLKSRSGMVAKSWITTEAGVIDSDYSSSIKVILRNFSNEPYYGKAGDRITQGVFLKLAMEYYPEIDRNIREGGFGSTGE